MRKSRNNFWNIFAFASAFLLAGCDTFAPVRTVYVKIEVPVKCAAGARPAKPVNRYGSLPAGTGTDYAIEALKGDRAAWETFGTDLEAKTAGCWEQPIK